MIFSFLADFYKKKKEIAKDLFRHTISYKEETLRVYYLTYYTLTTKDNIFSPFFAN